MTKIKNQGKKNKKTQFRVTSPNKLLFSESGVNKLELVEYYISVAHLMFPYLKDRPLSVVRCHEADGKNSFYKRHPSGNKTSEAVFSSGGEEYFYLKSESQIVMQAQLGTIEFHPWGSTVKKPDYPSVMVFDLDPDENLPLSKLCEGVRLVKNFLDEIDLTSFLKTSGKKGYHIVLPFFPCCEYERFSEFAKNIAVLLSQKYPKIFTDNIKKSNRKGRIFIDYLRNKKMSTCVCPYSVRISKTGGISMPILWENLEKIKPDEVTIKNYKNYLNSTWDNFFQVNQKIKPF